LRLSRKSSVRRAVWDGSGGACYHCGEELHPLGFHIDHLEPLCAGGPDMLKNMVASCGPCNSRKSVMSDRFLKRTATPIIKGMDSDDLRRRRIALDLTQGELARLLGVYQATISAWESGARGIRHPTILALALRWLAHEQTRTRARRPRGLPRGDG
jgi:DNA-binding transcriptional regulator YiaG